MDVDDLILNILGFIMGYVLYIVVKKALKKGEIGYAENFSSSRYAE